MNDLKHRFRMAMAKHLGQVVTPEMAAAIEVEAFSTPDRSLDPSRFAPIVHGDYRIGVESFRLALAELEPLHAAHWLETERHRHGIPLQPDYDALFARDRAGRLVQFTCRNRDGEIAGHLRMYLGQSTHTSTLVAEEDTLYMRPQDRGTFAPMAMLRYAEAVLIELGAREIRANSKTVNNADVLMRRLGYQHVAHQFVKILKENPHVR